MTERGYWRGLSPSNQRSQPCLKPIFHQNAKYLASGVGVGQCPRRQNFALPNAKYTNMLVYFALPDTKPPTTTLKFALAPTPTPDASQWNIGGVGPSGVGAGVGHVHFMFFVLISFAFCSQRKPSFRWNMGFTPPVVTATSRYT